MSATYLAVQQQLPPTPTLESFSSANQVGIAQLAVQYCNEVMATPSLQRKMFPGVTFNGSTFPSGTATRLQMTSLRRLVGSGLQAASRPRRR